MVLCSMAFIDFFHYFSNTEALAGSSVKLAGRDVLATWKLLVGLVLIPTLYGLYSLLAFIFLVRTEWNWKVKLFIPLTIWNTLPFISYASMRFAENGLEVYRLGNMR